MLFVLWRIYIINNYTLYECTHRCTTAHSDDGQARPKHVGATDWENTYNLCILLVFISNYTTVQDVEHTELSDALFVTILSLDALHSELRTYCCVR
jgi:hypothetical protein